jgi:exonuclease III
MTKFEQSMTRKILSLSLALNKAFLLFGILLTYTLSVGLKAQAPIIHLTFAEGDLARNKAIISPDNARFSLDLMRQQFTPGLADYALDLSENAMYRRPWVLDSILAKKIDTDKSFSVQVWVKTIPGASQGTPVIGNKKSADLAAQGWQIYTQENGAWALNLSDGNVHFDYIPTPRQKVNDGKWHQIVVSVKRPKNEACLYFDGNQVAIYNLEKLGNLSCALRTIVGGSDAYFEWGSAGQWKAFNGYLDEVKIWNRAISSKEVRQTWTSFFPEKTDSTLQMIPQQIKVMAWNIWHGGHRYGEHVGLQRTIDIIRESQADIICLIETYGSGEEIADALGFYFYLISSNLSIMSRYPITETIEAFRPFNFGGAVIRLSPGKEVLVFDTWLHYLPDYMDKINKRISTPEALIASEGETRFTEIKAILESIQPKLQNQTYAGILMAGDFNSGSHLDWIPATKNIHNGYIVKWPVSAAMASAGFIDSYRQLHINPATDPGYTWTPRAATSSDKYGIRDRIDYIFYKGDELKPIYSTVVDYHPVMFPSDHAAVVTVFRVE